MIEVFFRGYGCWYFEHRKSGRTYSISLTDSNRFILFPSSPEKVDFKSSSRSIQSIGFFYLSREDAFEYRHSQNHSMVRKLHPSSQYHSNATFTETAYSFFKDIFDSTITKITDQVEIGGLRINAEDCYLLIDIEQPFVFEVEDPDEFANTKTASKEETTPNKLNKKYHTLDIIEETSYQNIIAALLASINGELTIVSKNGERTNIDKHPSFETPKQLIEAINKHYKGSHNLSESSLYDRVVVKSEDNYIEKKDSRAEEIYQNLIAVLLACIEGKWPGTVTHPSFRGKTHFIGLIGEAYKDQRVGLSVSSLSRKFPAAKKSLTMQ